ncbi:alpha/beta hydrolase fold domain-containing protein [Ningiella sp. W23]|uniref:alpha/beta hydrolase fold domain-containing protein n=1 Tax=Ningiella sp. W23 TaxID=3023715 RepID=UPI003756D9A1
MKSSSWHTNTTQIIGHSTGNPDEQTQAIINAIAKAEQEKTQSNNSESGKQKVNNQAFIKALRENEDPLTPFFPDALDVHSISDFTFSNRHSNNIAIRLYIPKSEGPHALVVYFHGGCWVFCSLDTHDGICTQLCNKANVAVASIDYRLAPEAKFPAAYQDCIDACNYLYGHAKALDLDSDNISLMGDSAGGNLAAVVSQHPDTRARICSQVLLYPITDVSRLDRPSYEQYAENFFFEAKMMHWACEQYARNENDRFNANMSPLLLDTFNALPATLVQTAEFDVLRDEAEEYAARLFEAGADVLCKRYAGTVHAFAAMAKVVEQGQKALDDAAQFIKLQSQASRALPSEGAI